MDNSGSGTALLHSTQKKSVMIASGITVACFFTPFKTVYPFEKTRKKADDEEGYRLLHT